METQEKKQYIKPEIIFEADLEVKAGSPIDLLPPDPGGRGDPSLVP